MEQKNIKFIWALAVCLVALETWFLVDFKVELVVFLILVFALFISFLLLLSNTSKLRKDNVGLMRSLEKSEESRMISEKLKNQMLQMTDNLHEGFLIIDKDDKIAVINSRAEKFLGINKKQVLNKSVLDLGSFSNIKKIIVPMLVNFRGPHKEEIEVRKNLVLELVVDPMVLGRQNVAKLIVMRDITKVRLAQEAKNEFVSVTAHQLKSPLSAVRLSLKMLAAGDFGKVNKEQRDIIEKTSKKNESLIYLVDDLLREAKDEGTELNNKSAIVLDDLALQTIELYEDEMKRKKIDFSFVHPKKSPEIFADTERIKMVIQNLLDNAVKYTPEKGKIDVSIIAKEKEIEFRIKDSGIGIPQNQKDKIFMKFSRAVNTGNAIGSGLGLAISKDIIEKHRGRIWFQSKENEGSVFFFALPIVNT